MFQVNRTKKIVVEFLTITELRGNPTLAKSSSLEFSGSVLGKMNLAAYINFDFTSFSSL
jgi:hypothetical protein